MPIYEDEATEENFGAEWTWGTHGDEVLTEARREIARAEDLAALLRAKIAETEHD